MTTPTLTESPRQLADAVYDEVLNSGDGWTYELRQGQVLRIIDVEGNQAVDTLCYHTADTTERYSAVDTLRRAGRLYLSTGTELISTEGNVMATIVADTCGQHDTIGGACAAETNQIRYSLSKRHMHSCRDTYLRQLAHSESLEGMSKRDLTHNINFFMNVPVKTDGSLKFDDGVSAPGRYVEFQANMDLTLLVSNCPQLNNPCNGYDPTPARLVVWDA